MSLDIRARQDAGQGSIASSARSALTSEPLKCFFSPAGVAIIGASSDPRKLSHGILRNAISHGYEGAVYPVNPRKDKILGLTCYPDIASVPDPVELAVIVLPAAICASALTACGERGIRAAIIISGGFREAGPEGKALEEEVARIARSHGMRLVGPNCVGTLDAYSGLNTSFIRSMPRPGHIAFVSQSGAICGGILEWTAGKRIGFSRFATLGNAADVTETDMIEALAEDDNTRVIVAYIEAIRDGQHFISVASKVTPHKPILVIKAGTTKAGTRAVSSHTGSLAGEMAAYDAAFLQSGVIRVETLEELFNQALALAYGPLPAGQRVAVITNAGGPASLAADALEHNGLSMPALSSETRSNLAQHNHPEAQLGNPVDMLGGAEAAHYEIGVAALLADDAFDAVLPVLVPQALVDPMAVAHAIRRAAKAHDLAVSSHGKPVVACLMGDDAIRAPINALHDYHIAAYQFPEQAAGALGALWRYARHKQVTGHPAGPTQRKERATAHAEPVSFDREAAALSLSQARAKGQTYLGEWEARPVLAAYGVPQPVARLAHSASEAAQLAAEIGFPVVLKVVSPDVFHKSEVGGIVLKLEDGAAVSAAFDAMLRRVQSRQPEARIAGAQVTQMAPPGREVIVGMRRDPQFGPLLMFGLGGIYVELLQDVAFRVAPVSHAQVLGMIQETRAGKLLQGLRGQPASDVDAVATTIERVAQLALDHELIQEIDINPLIVYEQPSSDGQAARAGETVLALDVRLVIGSE